MTGTSARVGSGSHQYTVAEGWGSLPEHITFGYTHGIDVDADDRVYIFHTGNPSVVVFDKSGKFLHAWGSEYEGGAHGFYIHKEGEEQFIYLTDIQRATVSKTTLQGDLVFRLPAPELPDVYDAERSYKPTDVAVAPNGDIYTTDGYGQHYIHRYNARGEYVHSFGGPGSEPGKVKCPHGISVHLRHGETELYVADRANHRIQVFTPEGEHKRFIEDDMDRPCSFYFHGEEMYFPDLHSRVTVFGRDDRLLAHLGEDQQAYKQQGWPNLPLTYYRSNKFSSPHGVCVDSEKSVYVAEWTQHGRITKLLRV